MAVEFEITDRKVDDDTHVITVTGEIDLFTAPEFKQRMSELIDAGRSRLVVDLSETTFIDSSSLGVLIGAHRRLKLRGGALLVVCDSEAIAKTFKITGLDGVFTLATSVDDRTTPPRHTTYQRRRRRLHRGMRPPLPRRGLITAATLALGVGTAAAADETKPASREVAKLPAPDADASAAAARIDEEGSALGSYWDPDKAELVVVVGPDSDIGEPEAEARRRALPRRAPEDRQEDRRRDPRGDRRARVRPRGAEVHLREPPGPPQRPRRGADGRPPEVTERLLKEHPEEIELRESKPVEDMFHRRDDIPSFWGGAAIRAAGRAPPGSRSASRPARAS